MSAHQRIQAYVWGFLVLVGSWGAALGATWEVSTVSALHTAVRNAQPFDQIVVHPGTYKLTQVLNLHTANVTLRGATGNRDQVVLVGGGMNTRGVDEGISVGADGITLQHLTLKDFYFNAIHIRAELDADNTLISNVKTWNIGERHIKGSRDPNSSTKVSDNTRIERVYMLQTQPRTGHPDTNPDYIGGIDIMASRTITIRDSRAEGIVGAQNGGNAAIFLWNGIQGATIERNVIVGCAKGIALGNPASPAANLPTGAWHADGATIRNNVIRRGRWTTGNNIGIELATAKNVAVYHNTVYSDDAAYFRTLSFTEAQPGRNSGNILSRNLIRGRIFDRTSGGWQNTHNILDTTGTTITASWFANLAANDLHLTAAATAAIDKVPRLTQVPDDLDKQARPIGPAADIGADEFGQLAVGTVAGAQVGEDGPLAPALGCVLALANMIPLGPVDADEMRLTGVFLFAPPFEAIVHAPGNWSEQVSNLPLAMCCAVKGAHLWINEEFFQAVPLDDSLDCPLADQRWTLEVTGDSASLDVIEFLQPAIEEE